MIFRRTPAGIFDPTAAVHQEVDRFTNSRLFIGSKPVRH